MSFIEIILEQKRYEYEMISLQEEYEDLLELFRELKEEYDIEETTEDRANLTESITDFDPNMGMWDKFKEAERRFNTAKWAFGLTNKLKKPEDRKKHKRIVLTAMNQIRVVFNKLVKELTTEIENEDQKPQQTQQQDSPVKNKHSLLSRLKRRIGNAAYSIPARA